MTTKEMLLRAKQASYSAPLLSHDKKVEAVGKMCRRLDLARRDVLEANARDVERAREKLGTQMIDRLTLAPETEKQEDHAADEIPAENKAEQI